MEPLRVLMASWEDVIESFFLGFTPSCPAGVYGWSDLASRTNAFSMSARGT